jgi:F-box-like
MKRAHEDGSRLPPYNCRIEFTSTLLKNCECLLPTELYFNIFSDSVLFFQDLHSISQVCKSWNTVFINESFGSILLKREGLKKIKPQDTWVKTYLVWLKTQTFILLDCSASMPKISKKNVEELVKKKASEAFKNRWLKGVNLGVFANEYHLEHYDSQSKLIDFIRNIDMNLEGFDKTNSLILPLLKDVNTRIPRKDKAIKTFIHIISDCEFYQSNEFLDYIKKILLIGKNLSINFYKVGDSQPSFEEKLITIISKQKEDTITRIFYTKL